MLNLTQRIRRKIDSIDPQLRHRAVGGFPPRFAAQPERAFMADNRIVGGGFTDDQRPTSGNVAEAISARAPSQPVSSPPVISNTAPRPARIASR